MTHARRVLSIEEQLALGTPIDVHLRAARDDRALARRAKRGHGTWQLRADEREA